MTRIRTWVIVALTQCDNHYTIMARIVFGGRQFEDVNHTWEKEGNVAEKLKDPKRH